MSSERQSADAAALAERLFTAALATAELLSVHLGLRLGLYEALGRAPRTPPQLAAEARIAPRYAREWLEQQAVAGVIRVSGWDREPDDRVFRLPRGHGEALLDPGSRHAITPMALFPFGVMDRVLPHLLAAFRSGEGVAPSLYHDEERAAAGGLNRSIFTHELAGWIETALPDVHTTLQRPGARVVDVGCGPGWSAIALARAYPAARVTGLDVDAGALAHARAAAAREGLTARVSFDARDVTDGADPAGCELVCVFDALHDMARPVEALRACHDLLSPGGCVLLMEPRVAARFAAPGDEVERLMYAISLIHCLPVGLSEQPSAATGAVIREATVRAYAGRAGFSATTALPAAHRFYRLYRLDP